MLHIISIDELVPGMFVTEVIEQTGKLRMRSRGMVKSTETITMLKQRGILKLQIDSNKSKVKPDSLTTSTPAPVTEQTEQAHQQEQSKNSEKPLAEQLDQANELYQQSQSIQGEFLEKIRTGGRTNLAPINTLSQQIIDSVFEDSAALSLLTMIKNSDQYLLEHSINSAILMAIFARHLGLDSKLTEQLSIAGMLMDVGMATLPTNMLTKPKSLTRQEWDLVKSHVDISIELVAQSGGASDVVMDVVTNHHERINGEGYPEGKTAEQISTYARMAAIVDTYDALTSERPHQPSSTASTTFKIMLQDNGLDQSLVQQLIKCLGVHPVGSLVKLKSDKLAIVTRANHDEPLSPQVMAFYSVRSSHYSQIKRIDLSKSDDEIISAVRPDEFGINLNKFFKDVFLGAI